MRELAYLQHDELEIRCRLGRPECSCRCNDVTYRSSRDSCCLQYISDAILSRTPRSTAGSDRSYNSSQLPRPADAVSTGPVDGPCALISLSYILRSSNLITATADAIKEFVMESKVYR